MRHPTRKLLNSWDLSRFAGRRFVRTGQNFPYVLGTNQYSKPSEPVKYKSGGGPNCLYFSALKRFDRRDLYREAVFSWRTPF